MADNLDVLSILERRLARERAARGEAERLLEEKSEALYHSLTRAEASEALLQSALDSMADGLLLAKIDGEIILANRMMETIYPDLVRFIEPGRHMGPGFAFLLENEAYRRVLDGEAGEGSAELALDDGRTVSVIIGLTGEGYIASTHRDVTADKRAESERHKLLLDLSRSQRLEAIGRMTGMIAHDFNNIIAAISGFAGFLADDLAKDSANGKLADRIVSATERANALIGQILEYGNRQQAPMQAVSLVPMLEDCVDMIEPDLPVTGNLVFDPPEMPLWVRGSEKGLGRLFTNLLRNSLRAMEGRPGRLEIRVEALPQTDLRGARYEDAETGALDGASKLSGRHAFPDPCIRVTVIDAGCGIPPGVMERIFEMFYTTRPEGSSGGVGMSSVADILLECDAGIRIDSTEGVGTAVQVVLDRMEGPAVLAEPRGA